MVNFILVMVGGGLGARLREFFMLIVPNLAGGFPGDILVANLLPVSCSGLATGLHGRQVLSDAVRMLFGTGIMSGMSTFSSFAYGSVVLISASKASAAVASFYVVSLVPGYLAVIGGMKLGGQAKAGTRLAWSTKIQQALPKSTRACLVFGVYEEKRPQ